QTLQVLVDGNVVGTFNNLTGARYTALTTSSFAVASGSHTITFQGTNLAGGDNTVFIDRIAITQRTTALTDSGFESPALAGDVVGPFHNLAGTGYTALTTSAFTLEAGSHTVTFQGTNLAGGDNTVFIDDIFLNAH